MYHLFSIYHTIILFFLFLITYSSLSFPLQSPSIYYPPPPPFNPSNSSLLSISYHTIFLFLLTYSSLLFPSQLLPIPPPPPLPPLPISISHASFIIFLFLPASSPLLISFSGFSPFLTPSPTHSLPFRPLPPPPPPLLRPLPPSYRIPFKFSLPISSSPHLQVSPKSLINCALF